MAGTSKNRFPSVAQLWYRDRHGVRRQSSTYFIQYSYRGKRIREKTGKTNPREAYEILLRRREEVRTGRLIGPRAEKVTLETLAQLVVDDYASLGRRTMEKTLRRRFKPILEYFRGAKPLHITPADLTAYIVSRKPLVSPGTIHNELANLQRGFRIAVKSRMLPEVPEFPRMKLANARKVFIDRPTLTALLEHLPEDVCPILETALLTGWRKHAILSRQRHQHVDRVHRWLILDGKWSKNGEPVTVSMNRPLRAIFVRQERRARQLERATGRIIPWCFFYYRDGLNNRAGDQIRDFSFAFARARTAAGIPHVRFHDLRRGAIRFLRRAGASEHEIMEWVGLKTRYVFDRYDIIDEERRREVGERQEAYFNVEAKRRPKVAPFRRTP